LLTKGTSLHLH